MKGSLFDFCGMQFDFLVFFLVKLRENIFTTEQGEAKE